MRTILFIGDTVVTPNDKTGKVLKIEKDSSGSYAIVKLDTLFGEYAYDLAELRKKKEMDMKSCICDSSKKISWA